MERVRKSHRTHMESNLFFSVFAGMLLMETKSCMPSMIQGKNQSLNTAFLRAATKGKLY